MTASPTRFALKFEPPTFLCEYRLENGAKRTRLVRIRNVQEDARPSNVAARILNSLPPEIDRSLVSSPQLERMAAVLLEKLGILAVNTTDEFPGESLVESAEATRYEPDSDSFAADDRPRTAPVLEAAGAPAPESPSLAGPVPTFASRALPPLKPAGGALAPLGGLGPKPVPAPAAAPLEPRASAATPAASTSGPLPRRSPSPGPPSEVEEVVEEEYGEETFESEGAGGDQDKDAGPAPTSWPSRASAGEAGPAPPVAASVLGAALGVSAAPAAAAPAAPPAPLVDDKSLDEHLEIFSEDEEDVSDKIAQYEVDPEKDLNRVDEAELRIAKAKMDADFERNRVLPGDSQWEYDRQLEFQPEKSASWDEDEDGEEGEEEEERPAAAPPRPQQPPAEPRPAPAPAPAPTPPAPSSSSRPPIHDEEFVLDGDAGDASDAGGGFDYMGGSMAVDPYEEDEDVFGRLERELSRGSDGFSDGLHDWERERDIDLPGL